MSDKLYPVGEGETSRYVTKEELAVSESGGALKPPMSLLCKLGSVVVHAEEFLSGDTHQFDLLALKQLIEDSEVKEWIEKMNQMALLPKKRSG